MLQKFRHHNYTEFVFGKGAEDSVGEDIRRLGGQRVLIVYGQGGHIRKSGLLDKIRMSLRDQGLEVFELCGIQTNPRLSMVKRGIALCREEQIDFLLAIGGGSVIDTCKAIGVGFYYNGDVWDLVKMPEEIEKMLPIAVVLTYPAAGSESSTGAVITNDEIEPMVKASIGAPVTRPVIAFENPELTYSLPPYLTACGVADMYVHILERYFSPVEIGCMDYIAEGMLRAVIAFGRKVVEDPLNYDDRAEIMWLGTIAHNNTVGLGRPQDWATHSLGHEISALYDTAHGATLTIVGPGWMKYVHTSCIYRFARYAREVFGIDEADDGKAALKGIEATKEFYHDLGLPVSFEEAGIAADQIDYMAQHAVILGGGSIGRFMQLNGEDAKKIYELCLR